MRAPTASTRTAADTDSPAQNGRGAGDGAQSLNRLSVTATLHCMTGCVIGETVGLAIGTALGWSELATIALAIGLAFLLATS